MRQPSKTLFIALILILGWVAVSHAAPSLKPRLSTYWDDWLAETDWLLSDGEKAFFATLDSDDAKEAFVTALWESRGPEALERWAGNRIAADRLDPRSPWARRLLWWFGKPARIERREACGGLRPLQIWQWEPWQVERQGGQAAGSLTLVLAQESRLLPHSFRPWSPAKPLKLGYYKDPDGTLTSFLDGVQPTSCVSDDLRRRLAAASELEAVEHAMPWPEASEPFWYGELLTQIDLFGAPAAAAELELNYTGSNGRQTVLHGILSIDRAHLDELAPGRVFDRLSIVGDIYKGDYLVDSFEVVHHLVGTPPEELVSLDLFRGLRPGRYRMELRASDRAGMTLLHTTRQLEVPQLSHPAPPLPGRRQDYGSLTRSEVVLLDTFPSIEVLPVDTTASSKVEITAITTGGPIATVAFRLDGELVSEDSTPPYQTAIRLDGERHEIEASALDTDGRSLASHRRTIETMEHPFAVQLIRPTTEQKAIEVRLSVPERQHLDSVECFDGRTLVATPDAAPYRCPLPRLTSGGLRYARVRASLTDGESKEHLLFFGANAPDQIDVQLAEVLVSVFDQASGRPVSGLTEADFHVVDNGQERQLTRLESLADRPISVTVLMDLSSSMGRLAGLAATSAEHFFEDTMVEGDVASLLAFNDDFHQLVPFTGDIAELRLGTSGVRALGSTRLNDGVVWALGQFSGQQHRRALVILSDGADVNSDFPFEQVVAAAVEAGVVVYPISLARRGETPPSQLQKLAERSGGRPFVVGSIDQLDSAYEQIAQELRSQYLVVYRLGPDDAAFATRDVDITVRSGLAARNVRSHSP